MTSVSSNTSKVHLGLLNCWGNCRLMTNDQLASATVGHCGLTIANTSRCSAVGRNCEDGTY